MSLSTVMLTSLAALLVSLAQVQGNWNEWWTYDGISGPAYWGLINPAWTMCNKVTYLTEYAQFRVFPELVRTFFGEKITQDLKSKVQVN